MKISFDLDGTLFKYPNELIAFAKFMQGMGHEVGLLTGHSITHLEANVLPGIRQSGWEPSFYIGRDFEPPPVWDSYEKDRFWKPEQIEKHNIDIHFDDNADIILQANPKAKIIKII